MENQSCSRCPICKIVGLLVIIGALNWGVIGAIGVNYVDRLTASAPIAARVIYILIGIAGLLKLLSCFKACPCSCAPKK